MKPPMLETQEPWAVRKGKGRTVHRGVLGRWISALRYARRVRRDIDHLMAQDDRLLADIGLSRDEVDVAAGYGRLPHRAGRDR